MDACALELLLMAGPRLPRRRGAAAGGPAAGLAATAADLPANDTGTALLPAHTPINASSVDCMFAWADRCWVEFLSRESAGGDPQPGSSDIACARDGGSGRVQAVVDAAAAGAGGGAGEAGPAAAPPGQRSTGSGSGAMGYSNCCCSHTIDASGAEAAAGVAGGTRACAGVCEECGGRRGRLAPLDLTLAALLPSRCRPSKSPRRDPFELPPPGRDAAAAAAAAPAVATGGPAVAAPMRMMGAAAGGGAEPHAAVVGASAAAADAPAPPVVVAAGHGHGAVCTPPAAAQHSGGTHAARHAELPPPCHAGADALREQAAGAGAQGLQPATDAATAAATAGVTSDARPAADAVSSSPSCHQQQPQQPLQPQQQQQPQQPQQRHEQERAAAEVAQARAALDAGYHTVLDEHSRHFLSELQLLQGVLQLAPERGGAAAIGAGAGGAASGGPGAGGGADGRLTRKRPRQGQDSTAGEPQSQEQQLQEPQPPGPLALVWVRVLRDVVEELGGV
ncbi:hypothetical protein HXX76_002707 [Chlamydomonas incerta]|uniref:Uncharacterized protein n=1 Tax=Chlamydomonas incerta TaxID=51695 RepID=A0A835TF88_CHLIN|nr:hypothetical protein HXX76_002707 [Chlamydomonas incerta]|eukprot:KAG2442622.1 hypothetical protein HXX76_002707 [Chlamydomonas incerta]